MYLNENIDNIPPQKKNIVTSVLGHVSSSDLTTLNALWTIFFRSGALLSKENYHHQ